MFILFRHPRARRAGGVLAAGAAAAALPAAAQASAVNLGTAAPFVVLGGRPSPTPGRRCSTATSASLPAPRSPASACPPSSTARRTTTTRSPRRRRATSPPPTTSPPAQPVTADLTGQDLGGLTLTAGAYRFATSAQLTGALTLDAQGDPNAQFVFEIGSTLTTASASSVQLINGASPCNVYWQVGSSATLGSTTAFQGNMMALTSITLNNAATVRAACSPATARSRSTTTSSTPPCATRRRHADAAPTRPGADRHDPATPGDPRRHRQHPAARHRTAHRTPPASGTRCRRARAPRSSTPGTPGTPGARPACTAASAPRCAAA